MRRIVLCVSVLLLTAGISLAQQTPPSDYGIGNSTLSPNSDVGNNPSFSPDQNQAITNTRGSTTGDKYPNPAFAGSSGAEAASSALAQGAVGATGSTAATAGRRLPGHQNAARTSAKAKTRNAATAHQRTRRAKNSVPQQQGRTVIPPEQGPSTTEAPGPSTGVPGANLPQGGNGNYSGASTRSYGPGYRGPDKPR